MVSVLIIGPPRSGTTTIHKALTEAGLNSRHGSFGDGGSPIAVRLWQAFLEDRAPLSDVPDDVDVLCDIHITRTRKLDLRTIWPFHTLSFLTSVMDTDPSVKVILNRRDPEEWEDSIRRWKDLHKRIVKSDLPYLPAGAGKKPGELAAWIQWHYLRVNGAFMGIEGNFFGDGKRFLDVNIADSTTPRKIERFLGVSLPWWGVENANPRK